MPGEQSWPTQPVPTKPEPYIKHTFGVDDISPYLSPEEAEAFKKRLLAATNKGVFTPISYSDTVHIPTSNGGTLFGGTAAEPRTGAVYIIAHDNPGILQLIRPGENAGRGAGGGPPVPPGQARLPGELPGRVTGRTVSEPTLACRWFTPPTRRPITSSPERLASTRRRSAQP